MCFLFTTWFLSCTLVLGIPNAVQYCCYTLYPLIILSQKKKTKKSNINISSPLSNLLTMSDAKTNSKLTCLSFSNPQLTLLVSPLTTHTKIYLFLLGVVSMLPVWLFTESYAPDDSINQPSYNTWHSIWMGKRPLCFNFSFRLPLPMYLYPRDVSLYHCTTHDWATTPKSTIQSKTSY